MPAKGANNASSGRRVKISVTMPVYNAESYVRESIESVLAQDFSNYELLILDDGSQDCSRSIINEYRNHPKVRVIFRSHAGIGKARNALVKLSRGEYISPHDADDVMAAGKLKAQSDFLDGNPNIGVVCGKIVVIAEDGHSLGQAGESYDRKKELAGNRIAQPSTMIRRSCIEQAGGYNEILTLCIDYDLWLKLAEITEYAFMDKFFCFYRRHQTSLSSCTTKKRHMGELRAIKKGVRERRGSKRA